MTARAMTAGAFAAVVLVACHDSPTIPHTPTTLLIVSGNNQAANVATALDSALVVRVVDGAGRPVGGVPLKWAVTGGGTLSAASTTSDNNGSSSVKWTLSPTVGTQVASVTSTQLPGASVSFVAGNGPTIAGFVTPIAVSPFGATFSLAPSRVGLAASTSARAPKRPQSNRIVIGFKNDVMGLAPAGSMSYRSMPVARAAAAQLKKRVGGLASIHGLGRAQVSPAILAARVSIDDTSRIATVIDALRGEPDVAYVERESFLTIRDGAPRVRVADASALASVRTWETPSSAGPSRSSVNTLIPNDHFFPYQMGTANMVDLPKAWALTTGSASVTVAVLDMGVRFEHPSVAPNLTQDGYDFVNGFAFDSTNLNCDDGKPFPFTTTSGDGDGPDPDPTDVDDIDFDPFDNCWFHLSAGDHGLWTSGIIGAAGNQNLGIAGVNWNVKIRPVRVLDIMGSGSFFDIAQGVLYAAGLPALGADSAMVQTTRAPIINLSLGGGFDDPAMRDAVAAAVNANVLIVASAGNNGLDVPIFPAAYPGVMAVAAVGMDGALATYTNAGTAISVAAPGGDFRFDDNGGGGVIGPGWDFEAGGPDFIIGYGTSASAPFVSGIAALLLSQNASLTAAQLRARIEQFASRPAGASRSDSFGWGIVNAYNALTQTNGPARQASARLIDATTGVVARTIKVNADGSFAFTKLASGSSYFLQAGEDEASDGVIGVPGRRFSVAGGLGAATVFNVNGDVQTAAISLGLPVEAEPNDDVSHANLLAVGSYVVGNITTPDTRDMYRVTIPTAGTYTFETTGLVGTCGLGIELDTFLTVSSAAGTSVGSSDNLNTLPNPFCSRVRVQLTPGIYYATVSGSLGSAPFTTPHGRYRLEVRSGN